MHEFMNIDFHFMLSLDLTFDVFFINLLFIYHLLFLSYAVFIILN